MPSDDQVSGIERAVLLFLFALLLFAAPMLDWWASVGAPWYLPYCLWLLIIALAAWSQRKRGLDDL